jgi:hypothetical protein
VRARRPSSPPSATSTSHPLPRVDKLCLSAQRGLTCSLFVRAPTEWSNPPPRRGAKSTTTWRCLSSRVAAIVSGPIWIVRSRLSVLLVELELRDPAPRPELAGVLLVADVDQIGETRARRARRVLSVRLVAAPVFGAARCARCGADVELDSPRGPHRSSPYPVRRLVELELVGEGEGLIPRARALVREPTDWSKPAARESAKSTTTWCCLSSRVSAIASVSSPRPYVPGSRVRFPDVAPLRGPTPEPFWSRGNTSASSPTRNCELAAFA